MCYCICFPHRVFLSQTFYPVIIRKPPKPKILGYVCTQFHLTLLSWDTSLLPKSLLTGITLLWRSGSQTICRNHRCLLQERALTWGNDRGTGPELWKASLETSSDFLPSGNRKVPGKRFQMATSVFLSAVSHDPEQQAEQVGPSHRLSVWSLSLPFTASH